MGLAIDLRVANWLATILEPDGRRTSLDNPFEEREALHQFLDQLRTQFISTRRYEDELSWRLRHVSSLIQDIERDIEYSNENPNAMDRSFALLRDFFSDRPWTALLVPSMRDRDIDERLCSREFLERLVYMAPGHPGLIIQLRDTGSSLTALTGVFSPFKIALAEAANWPGVLVWTRRGEVEFFPLGDSPVHIEEHAVSLFKSFLYPGFELSRAKQEYLLANPTVVPDERSKLTIIQLSDLHIGSRHAELYLRRLKQLVLNLIDELGVNRNYVIALNGDILDHPDERNLRTALAFIEDMERLAPENVIGCYGNHDVREHGFLRKKTDMAIQIPHAVPDVWWFNEQRVGIVTFDSVRGGQLARGFVGEDQLITLANKLDNARDFADFQLVGMLHHHPIPVEVPEWYVRPFYERIFGKNFDKTDELEDSDSFMRFVSGRKFCCLLHGHKHIPRIAQPEGGPAIFGCGSSVGKIDTADRRPYLSMNVISVNGRNGQVVGRLLAERDPGVGTSEQSRLEIVAVPRKR